MLGILAKRPFSQLFVYAILHGNFETAEVFWKRCEEQVAIGLVAVNVLKSIGRKHSYCYPDACNKMKECAG